MHVELLSVKLSLCHIHANMYMPSPASRSSRSGLVSERNRGDVAGLHKSREGSMKATTTSNTLPASPVASRPEPELELLVLGTWTRGCFQMPHLSVI